MTQETICILLVLLAALLHAGWNAFIKSGESKLLTLCLVMCTSSAICMLAAPFLPVPDPESWPYIFLSVVLHTIYFAFLLLAYREGDLSHVYPIMRGLSPLVIAVLSWFAAGEALTAGSIAGVCMVSLGIMSLTFANGVPNRREHRALFFALCTGLSIAGYTVVDGLGVRKSGAPLGYIAWLFVFDAIPLTAFTIYVKRREIRPFLARHWGKGVLGGVQSLAAYGIVIWALGITEMALVSALRETSVIFAAAIGCTLFHEPFGRTRILASILVAAGAVLMNVYR